MAQRICSIPTASSASCVRGHTIATHEHNQGTPAKTSLADSEGAARGPRFSIVIPTRDRPRQIEVCLQALAELDYPSDAFEVLIVDDGSVHPLEGSVDVSPGLDVQFLRQEHAGPASARNTGAAAARAPYLGFIDDDCLPDSQWLSAMDQELRGIEETCLGGITVNDLPHNIFSSTSQLLIDYLYMYYDAPKARFFCSNNMCVPATAFQAIGGFDTGFPLPAGEDRDFCSRWHEAGYEMRLAPEAVARHAHELSAGGFFHQHFRYGRGAYYYHMRRASRSERRLRLEPLRFYRALFQFPFRRMGFFKAVPACALLFVSQVANAAGFFWERGKQRAESAATTRVRDA